MKRRNSKSLICMMLLAMVIFLGTMFGCAGSGQSPLPGTFDPANVEKTIATIQTVQKSIVWIIPLAGSVIAIFAPEALPAYKMAAASYNALNVVTDNAIAAYRGNPTEENARKLTDVLAQLQEAWAVLDGAYKGDPAAISTLQGAAK